MSSSLPIHPVTGLRALAMFRGKPMFPVMGGSPDATPAEATAAARAAAQAVTDAKNGTTTPVVEPVVEPVVDPAATAAPVVDPDADTKVGPNGFPVNTPWKDMAVEHQVAYWKHQSRKHEGANSDAPTAAEIQKLKDENEALRTASLSTEQREIAAQIETSRTEGYEKARAEYLPFLQESQIRSYAANVLDGDRLDAWMESVNVGKFVNADDSFINGVAVVEHLTKIFGPKNAEIVTPPATSGGGVQNWGQGQSNPGGRANNTAGALEALKRRGIEPK